MANYNKFAFDPSTGFLDGTSYPNPANETAARTQMQSLHNQTRDYLNTLCAYYGSSDSNVIRFRVDTNAKLQYSRDGSTWNDVIPAQIGTTTVGSSTKPVYVNNGTLTQCSLATVASSGSYSDLTNKPTYATVATSGSYNDLSNKPSINNATLTIQKNGSSVATFTANSASNVTANIVVPTKTSQLTNDSGLGTGSVTSVAVKMNGSTKGTVTTSGTIDLGTVITAHQSLSGYQKAITISTSSPSGGSNGDIWLKRES